MQISEVGASLAHVSRYDEPSKFIQLCNVFAECESNNMAAARKLYLTLCVTLLSIEIRVLKAQKCVGACFAHCSLSLRK
jgi:hypothetical protein